MWKYLLLDWIAHTQDIIFQLALCSVGNSYNMVVVLQATWFENQVALSKDWMDTKWQFYWVTDCKAHNIMLEMGSNVPLHCKLSGHRVCRARRSWDMVISGRPPRQPTSGNRSPKPKPDRLGCPADRSFQHWALWCGKGRTSLMKLWEDNYIEH